MSERRVPSPTRASTSGLIAWAMYDWANQAFGTLIHTFVFSVYFTRHIAESQTGGTAQWGTAIGLAGLSVAVLAPLLGAMADQGGRHKPWIAAFTLLCVSATALLWFAAPTPDWVWLALVLVALATVGSELALVFYNSMLPRLAERDRIGRWSGWSWGLGFTGGLVSLIVALLLFLWPAGAGPALGAEAGENARATALFVAGWYLVFALPFFFLTPDVPGSGKRMTEMARDGLRQIRTTFGEIRRYGHILRFLVARMFYIDGLATLFAFGGIYAAGTFGMSPEMVLLFGIALNVSAGIGAFGFAWVDDWIGSKATIILSLFGLIIPGALILLVESSELFWAFALALGIFIGPAQAAGRSFMARIAPEELQNQMFGFFAFSGKATAFVGPLLVAGITQWTGSQRLGMVTVVVFFAIGLAIMFTVPSPGSRDERLNRPDGA